MQSCRGFYLKETSSPIAIDINEMTEPPSEGSTPNKARYVFSCRSTIFLFLDIFKYYLPVLRMAAKNEE